MSADTESSDTTSSGPLNESLNSSCCLLTTIAILGFLLLVVIILFKYKNPFQFYVKWSIYVCITMSYATLSIPFLCLRPNNSKNIQIVSKQLSWIFKIFKVDIALENAKYLQIKEPYILINNHQSALDFLIMMKVWPGGNCSPLAKKELLYTGPFGLAIWLAGLTFIDRLNPQSSRDTLNSLSKRINDENMRVWIYPEGSRSSKTELLPFKKGAFHLAIQAQIPIVCMVTSSYANFFSMKERKYNFNGQVKVRVLPPFQTKGMTSDSVNQLTKHLQDTMQKEFDTLNKEINLDPKYYTQSKTRMVDELLPVISTNLNDDSIDLTQNDDNNNSIIDSPPSPEKKFN